MAFKFEAETRKSTLILRLEGDLMGDSPGTGILDTVSNAILNSASSCIIDISGLRYINSSGIGLLITILTKFRNKGGEVYLLNPSENVKKLLVITKLNAIFQIVRTESEVIKD
jgi:anti-sigma B factor antagonist